MRTTLIYFFTILSSMVFAQTGYDIQPDRPGLGESSQVLRKGYLQIESGGNYQWDKQENGFGTSKIITRETNYNSTFLRFGFSDFCEFRLAWNIVGSYRKFYGGLMTATNKTPIGFSPLSLGFKAKVLEGDGWIPSTALLGMMGIPKWASSHLTSSSFSPSLLLPMEWDLSDRLLLTINNGLFWDGEAIKPSYFASLSLDWMALKKVGLFIEAYNNYRNQTSILPGINGGVLWRVRENLQLDLSSGFGLTSEMPNGFINGGISYRINFNKKG